MTDKLSQYFIDNFGGVWDEEENAVDISLDLSKETPRDWREVEKEMVEKYGNCWSTEPSQ